MYMGIFFAYMFAHQKRALDPTGLQLGTELKTPGRAISAPKHQPISLAPRFVLEDLFLLKYIYVCVCGGQEHIRSPRVGVTGGCHSPDVGAGN